MELVQTDIRADSHDSESKISDEVEANVSLRRRARWPKEGLSAALFYRELPQKQICCFLVRKEKQTCRFEEC